MDTIYSSVRRRILKMQKGTLFVFIVLLASITFRAFGETPLIGFVSQNTTWIQEKSPYIVKGNIIVKEGVTLIIEPGVTVKFSSGFSLSVKGSLVAKGLKAQMITFTSDQSSPKPGDWKGIIFEDSSVEATFNEEGIYLGGSTLQHCRVLNAETAVKSISASPYIGHCHIANNANGGISISADEGIPVFISNNRIVRNNRSVGPGWGGGIYVNGSAVTIDNNIVINNTVQLSTNVFGENATKVVGMGGGICVMGGTATISENVVSRNSVAGGIGNGNYGGGIAVRNTEVSVIRNTVFGNAAKSRTYVGLMASDRKTSGGGIYINSRKFTVAENLIAENSAKASGGGISIDGLHDTGVIKHNIVIDNSSPTGGGIYGAPSTTGRLTVNSNTIAANEASYGGGIFLKSITANISENRVIGNVVDGNDGAYGAGIYIRGPVTIIGNIITKNWISASLTSGGVALAYFGSGEVTNNIIARNVDRGNGNTSAVYIGGNPALKNNAIIGNFVKYALRLSKNKNSPNLRAIDNYWGLFDESEIRMKVYDAFADSSMAVADVSPFLKENPVPDLAQSVLGNAEVFFREGKLRLALLGIQAVINVGMLDDTDNSRARALFIKALNDSLEQDFGVFRKGIEVLQQESREILSVHDWNGNWEIYALDSTDQKLVNLTKNPANDSAPAWSPDGTRIAFFPIGSLQVFT
jgi:hypothetical protein